MKTEEQIKEEIRKHREKIINPFSNRTLEEKLHDSVIYALEWVLKEETNETRIQKNEN